MSRTGNRVRTIEGLVESTKPAISLESDPRDESWPVQVRLTLPSNSVVSANLYVSTVSSMARPGGELRFQNPGQDRPIELSEGRVSLLLGVYTDDDATIYIAADAVRRADLVTRFSVRFPGELIIRARHTGWSTYESSNGEVITALHPSLLTTYVDAVYSGTELLDRTITEAVEDSGVLVDDTQPNRDRLLVSVQRLARDSKFGRTVKAAYEFRCAMCGLGLGLLAAAHILPVAAPGSTDQVQNGIALCDNHHRAFDRHLIRVDPESFAIVMRPELITGHAADDAFVATTLPTLRTPAAGGEGPSPEFLRKRLEYFDGSYDWARL